MYTHTQWLLFFFIYSVLGWLWEMLYVSPRERKLVNRGFLHGPWLPIYGFAGIIIIAATRHIADHTVLVFLCGLIGGTALEYFSGALIDKLFNVRYWDYSNRPLNIKGYIWLPYCIAWGFLAIIFTKYIQPFVKGIVFAVPPLIEEDIVFVLLILFSADTTLSVLAAYDLKKLLETITKNNTRLKELETVVKDAVEDLAKTSAERRIELNLRLKYVEDTLERNIKLYKENQKNIKNRGKANSSGRKLALLSGINNFRNIQQNMVFVLEKKLDAAEITARLQLNDAKGKMDKSVINFKINRMNELQEKVQAVKLDIMKKQERDYKHALDIIHRNNTTSSRFAKALNQLKSIINE